MELVRIDTQFNLFLTSFVYRRGVSTPRDKARIATTV